jgi:hypothetical protein
MICFVIGLDIKPEGIDSSLLQGIEVLGCETITIGLYQHPEAGLCLDETSALQVKLGAAGEISPGEGNDVACWSPSLGTQENLLLLNDLRAEG